MKRLILPLLFILISVGSSLGQAAKFHSGFIFHFTKYIEWPSEMKQGSFVVAVVGKNDVSTYLTKLAQVRKVGVQTMVVKKCSSISEAKGAHIIFVSDSHLSSFSKALEIAKSGNSLLITDEKNYAKKGSLINFVDKNGKMQFELNKKSFDKSKLKISQQLLKLAIII